MNEKYILVVALVITIGIAIIGCDDSLGPVNQGNYPDTTDEDTTDVDTTQFPDSLKREIEDIVIVPAGWFWMGSNTWYYENDEIPQHQIYVDSFYIMQYEVTNQQYAQFLTEIDDPSPHYNGDMMIARRSNDYLPISGRENFPVFFVDWDDARSFAEWYGGRLPTEAEWEKAARGNSDRRVFPWGDQISPGWANFNNAAGGLWPVGQAIGVSPYDCYDMVGNVWEWTADWYLYNYYSRNETNNPRGPIGPVGGQFKTLRGGCFSNSEAVVRCSERFAFDPELSYLEIGFRVVFSPDSVKPAE
jgi:formylglycine-generating enzyme required for sulfatase activity